MSLTFPFFSPLIPFVLPLLMVLKVTSSSSDDSSRGFSGEEEGEDEDEEEEQQPLIGLSELETKSGTLGSCSTVPPPPPPLDTGLEGDVDDEEAGWMILLLLLPFAGLVSPPPPAELLWAPGASLMAAAGSRLSWSVWHWREISLGPTRGSQWEPFRREISSISRRP